MAEVEKVLRISQLDVSELDNDLTSIMQEKFIGIFKALPQVSFLTRLKPELKAGLRYLLWKWSMGNNECTFGQQMMGLKYSTNNGMVLSKHQRWFLFAYFVCIEWIQDRFEDIFNTLFPSLQADRLLDFIKSLFQLANMINFCFFLLQGRYPSLKERLLRIKIVSKRRQSLRELNYDYMNREIIWYGFSEFMFFVLPHMNLPALRNWFRTMLNKIVPSQRNTLSSWSEASSSNCALCDCPPVLPQITQCKHIYCYYCIAANVKADSNFPCTICNQPVLSYVHLNGVVSIRTQN